SVACAWNSAGAPTARRPSARRSRRPAKARSRPRAAPSRAAWTSRSDAAAHRPPPCNAKHAGKSSRDVFARRIRLTSLAWCRVRLLPASYPPPGASPADARGVPVRRRVRDGARGGPRRARDRVGDAQPARGILRLPARRCRRHPARIEGPHDVALPGPPSPHRRPGAAVRGAAARHRAHPGGRRDPGRVGQRGAAHAPRAAARLSQRVTPAILRRVDPRGHPLREPRARAVRTAAGLTQMPAKLDPFVDVLLRERGDQLYLLPDEPVTLVKDGKPRKVSKQPLTDQHIYALLVEVAPSESANHID